MKPCDPSDIAIKAFFLGPQTENGDWLRAQWLKILDDWLTWRRSCFPEDGSAISKEDRQTNTFKESQERLEKALQNVLNDLQDETIKFSPRYIGHMVSEVSLPGMLGHICALLHNPNNTSREVSRVTSRLEEEAIAGLATMLGYSDQARGHFTSGGTLANFEALWRALVRLDHTLCRMLTELDPTTKPETFSLLERGPIAFSREFERVVGKPFLGPVVMVPHNRHFSWDKGVSLMGLGHESLWSIALDKDGRLDLEDLKIKLAKANELSRPVAMVVSVAGTTEMGAVDPIDQVAVLLDEWRNRGLDIWHHVDAAYGGYYATLLDNAELESKLAPRVRSALRALRRVDSVTLDPHKLGYVPYACGAFISKDEDHYHTRSFSAAYLSEGNGSRWVSTLEGSRSGAGPTATWLANHALGLDSRGYGRLLAKGLEARDSMINELRRQIGDILLSPSSDLNIICFGLCAKGSRLSECNERVRSLYHHFEKSPRFSVSKTILRLENYKKLCESLARERGITVDSNEWFLIRLVLMNPFIVSRQTRAKYVEEFVDEIRRHMT